jgi:hypothetical protein
MAGAGEEDELLLSLDTGPLPPMPAAPDDDAADGGSGPGRRRADELASGAPDAPLGEPTLWLEEGHDELLLPLPLQPPEQDALQLPEIQQQLPPLIPLPSLPPMPPPPLLPPPPPPPPARPASPPARAMAAAAAATAAGGAARRARRTKKNGEVATLAEAAARLGRAPEQQRWMYNRQAANVQCLTVPRSWLSWQPAEAPLAGGFVVHFVRGVIGEAGRRCVALPMVDAAQRRLVVRHGPTEAGAPLVTLGLTDCRLCLHFEPFDAANYAAPLTPWCDLVIRASGARLRAADGAAGSRVRYDSLKGRSFRDGLLDVEGSDLLEIPRRLADPDMWPQLAQLRPELVRVVRPEQGPCHVVFLANGPADAQQLRDRLARIAPPPPALPPPLPSPPPPPPPRGAAAHEAAWRDLLSHARFDSAREELVAQLREWSPAEAAALAADPRAPFEARFAELAGPALAPYARFVSALLLR